MYLYPRGFEGRYRDSRACDLVVHGLALPYSVQDQTSTLRCDSIAAAVPDFLRLYRARKDIYSVSVGILNRSDTIRM